MKVVGSPEKNAWEFMCSEVFEGRPFFWGGVEDGRWDGVGDGRTFGGF